MPTAPQLRSALLVVLASGCGKPSSAPAPASSGAVPRVAAITLDGELHEPAWNQQAPAFTFTDRGSEARPYSQLRVLHDGEHLYLGLYAADQDIRSTDRFLVWVGERALAIDPHGAITPAATDVTAAIDLDGTLDDRSDEDEEWVVELAMPLPVGAFALRASRCDTPKDGIERCGDWASPAPLTLAP